MARASTISGDVITLSVSADPGRARAILVGYPGVRDLAAEGMAIRMTVTGGEQALPGILRALDTEGITLESIQLARPTLDDVFLTLTGRSLRDDSPSGTDSPASSEMEPKA
ncbi:MAG TPA: DUF4162 domain-containing protein [Streptosporangiaceae bacterium]